MQVVEMKTKLEEKIKALEKEKTMLLEEITQLKEVVELNEKAKELENEVNKLKREAKSLKDRLPREYLQELGEVVSALLEENEKEKTLSEECSSCEDKEMS